MPNESNKNQNRSGLLEKEIETESWSFALIGDDKNIPLVVDKEKDDERNIFLPVKSPQTSQKTFSSE